MIPSHLYSASFKTGSRYICDPPVLNTDNDEMFLVYSIEESMYELLADGWELCSEDYGGASTNWQALRKGTDNALITADFEYFSKFEAATELAKKRNLLRKKDRIALFAIILGDKLKYGKTPF